MPIKLNQKDRSLLLLITAALILIISLYSLFSYLFFNSTYPISQASKIIEKADKDKWINVSRPLEISDIKGKVILLDFWTYSCVNCFHILPDIKKLEQEYGNKLLVIGVHSGKFTNEKDFEFIKKAVLKFDLDYPVIDDSSMALYNHFKIDAYPTLVLLTPKGSIKKIYRGDEEARDLVKEVGDLIDKYRYQINRTPLPIMLERNKIAKRVLNYPTKIEYSENFSYKSYKGPALFIANSGQNNILAISMVGEIIAEIGSNKSDYVDGDFESAAFRNPMGLLFKNNKLYVADSQNHAIREVDFVSQKVSTILGNGVRGKIISQTVDAKEVMLSSPVDIESFTSKDLMLIANSGSNQILQYNFVDNKISVIAGNGEEGIKDGKYPDNSLAQPSDMVVYNQKVYFVDAKSSALRVIDTDRHVKTLIGKSLTDFGHKNGDKAEALMQNPLGITANSNGIFIADSFNNVIRKYSNGKIQDFIGGQKGEQLGSKTEFDEPNGIILIKDKFYIVDSNNNRIVTVNTKKLNSGLLDVMPKLQLPKEGFLQYLPNLYKAEPIEVASKDSSIKIDLKDDWKINDLGPSFINLLEMISDKEAHLIATFDWNMIKNEELKLPKLEEGKKYMLQGTIYYCEKKLNALCYISSYEQQISADDNGKNNVINVELIYE